MKILAAIGAIGLVIAAAAGVFFFGGFFNVAGTQEDHPAVAWALIKVREASIRRHATEKAPPLDGADMVRAGAAAYAARGCVACHGGPGVAWQKFSEGLHPDPPDLKKVVTERSPEELFFVVKNGINMTGMPSFKLAGVDDPEIWSIVAFLKKLPDVSEQDFKTWSASAAK
jgi:mono/diheme cytochrome c family protein